MNAPCSGAICMRLTPPRAWVVAMSDSWTASGGEPWATQYACSSAERPMDFGSVTRSTVPLP